MIKSIRHKGLRLLWTKNDASKLPRDHVIKLSMILQILDAGRQLNDFDFPGASLHALQGKLDGYWAVTVRANWRIVFKFLNGDVYLVNYLDYH